MKQQQDNENRRIPPQPRKAERGQAIVIMAASMVALLAILGLAVDGGGMFFLWRDLQNATDASALAASYARCTTDANQDMRASIVSAANQAAAENGFTSGVTVYWNPLSPDAPASIRNDDAYVEVRIDAEKPAYFIQIVYKEPLTLNNTAIGFCVERFDPATVPAVWGGSTTCQDAVSWSGSDATLIGGAHSNTDFKMQGADGSVEGGVGYVGGSQSNNTDYNGDPPATAPVMKDPLRWLKIEDFAPGGKYTSVPKYHVRGLPFSTAIFPNAHNNVKANGTWDPPNGTVLEGMYYIDGNVNISHQITWGANGATIVATGEITWGAKDNQLYTYYTELAFPLILFSGYESPNCGVTSVSLSGNGLDVTGIFYAPRANLSVSFARSRVIGAFIANTVNNSGSELYLRYDPSSVPPINPSISMAD